MWYQSRIWGTEEGSGEAFKVTAIETKDKILKICSERGDTWAEAIRTGLLNIKYLPAADAVNHQTCNVNFQTKRQIPRVYEVNELPAVKKRKVGRPKDEEKLEAFVKVTKFLEENDDEQITVIDLVEKMEEYLIHTDSATYGRQHMKTKLLEYFGDKIIITDIKKAAVLRIFSFFSFYIKVLIFVSRT